MTSLYSRIFERTSSDQYSRTGTVLAALLGVVVAAGCGQIDSPNGDDQPEVPTYRDQKVQGTVEGRDFEVVSARAWRAEGEDNLNVQLYERDHGDICNYLHPANPSPEEGDRKIEMHDVAPSTGRSSLVEGSDENEYDNGTPELSFSKRNDEAGSWSGVPYARGWIEVTEVDKNEIRAKLAAVKFDDNEVTGHFTAERCGCPQC